MPPVVPEPDKIKPWEPVAKPSTRPKEPNRTLARYEQAQEEWKDSSPAYRHVNPRPETWIPGKILETNYKIPTSQETDKRRQEYLTIVEDIKDQIPPDYYWEAQERYSKPPEPDRRGPDQTGRVDGYDPTMLNHPWFREKDHTRYNALPREKMDPEMEKLYKMREVYQVKESLDVPEDNGVDYGERMLEKVRKEQEREISEDRRVREEVFTGTHWIDWETGKDGWIPDPSDSQEDGSEVLPSPTSNPHGDGKMLSHDPPAPDPSAPGDLGNTVGDRFNAIPGLISLAIGGSVAAILYAGWRLVKGINGKSDGLSNKEDESFIREEVGGAIWKRTPACREWREEK